MSGVIVVETASNKKAEETQVTPPGGRPRNPGDELGSDRVIKEEIPASRGGEADSTEAKGGRELSGQTGHRAPGTQL